MTNDREEGLAFQPKFDASGLVTCVATDAATGDVLMVAHMNDEALRKTIASGEAWYFSRSRNALWRKGETSGQTQRVVEMRMDCDQDAVWIRVEQTGRGVPHRAAFVLLSQGRRGRWRRAVVIRRCGQAVRSKGGLPRIAWVRLAESRSCQQLGDHAGCTPCPIGLDWIRLTRPRRKPASSHRQSYPA